jgi:AcrR family transcriptional regulator
MGEDKRQEILNAALTLFVELGFHGTPTSKIAQAAGVANGTLFHYFKTKDELVVALYIEVKVQLANYIETLPSKDLSYKARCKREITGALRWALQHQLEFRFIQQFLSSPYLSLLDPKVIEQQAQKSFNLIQEGLRTQVFKPLPLDYLYTLVSSHTYGLFQYLTTSPLSATEQDRLIDESFEMMWGMIKA